LPAAAFEMPPDRQLRVGTPPGTAASGKLEEEVEVIPLAPTEPFATPESQRQSGRITAAPLPEGAKVIRFAVSTKSAQLQRFVTRVREFVARMRAPRRPNALDGAGSAAPVAAAVPAWPVGRAAAAGTAEPYVRTGEARDRLREDTGEARDRDTEPFQQENIADAKPAETSPAETSEDTLPESAAAEAAPIDNVAARRGLGLDASAPVVLFAGDLSHDAGADILFDAIVTVCGGNHEAQFLFAGDGALKGQLQEWASRAGLDRRCRFLGHVPSESFNRVLVACDFVVIPARVRQGEELARMAIVAGKPVVTTHQAAIPFIVHGRNGLIAYDNPGSLVWAIRALLGPLYADLRLQLAESTRLGSAA
jgi:glycosyltransferase involved in cell wall biosynthesis